MAKAAADVANTKERAARIPASVPRVIALDGPAAAGKSTVGRRLAGSLGYPFLDTGSMYRAVTWAALQHGVDLGDDDALGDLASSLRIDVQRAPGEDSARILVDGGDVTDHLRSPEVEAAVSLVSRVAEVREALVRAQRELAGRRPVVMAGRGKGTVVLPDADLKVYLDASVEERARRRHEEMASLGREASPAPVPADLRRPAPID